MDMGRGILNKRTATFYEVMWWFFGVFSTLAIRADNKTLRVSRDVEAEMNNNLEDSGLVRVKENEGKGITILTHNVRG